MGASCEIPHIVSDSCSSEYLDDITNLQDPDLFASIIEEELSARAQRLNDKIAPDQTRNPSFIGATIANRYLATVPVSPILTFLSGFTTPISLPQHGES